MTRPEPLEVRVGVLGLGRIGRMHANLLGTGIPGARLAAVADADPDALEAVTDRFPVPGADDPSRLLARSDIDAVAICTPTSTHVDLIVAAAEAGKAILCEKPVSLDLEATDQAVAAAERAGVILQVGFNRRFDPGHATVAGAVANGEIGAPELVRISSRDPTPPPIDYLASSGGIFLDQTIHDLDMARFVTGSEVERLTAVGTVRVDPAIRDIGDYDTVAVTLQHANGCITQIDNSRRAVYGYDQRVEVLGSAGMAFSDNQAVHGAVVRTDAGGRVAPLPWFFLERYMPSYRRQWEAFLSAYRGENTVAVGGEDARAALVLALAAAESVRTGHPVGIPAIPADETSSTA